jgi:S1-C subfamily serine protease
VNADQNPPDNEPNLPAAAEDFGEPLATAATEASPAPRGLKRRAVSVVGLIAVGAAAGAGISYAAVSPSSSGGTSAASGNANRGLTGNAGGTYGEGGGGSFGGGFPGGDGFQGAGGYLGGLGFPGGGATGGGSGGSGSASSNASDGPTDAASIARDTDAGLVDITTTVSDGEAAGTGMVISPTGEVLTNNHVIDGATSISVRDVGDGTTYKATVVGYDRSQDVAVLRLTGASGLTTVKTATSEPGTGASVVGVGNAGGTGGTPSYAGGAITATNQSITASDEYDGTSEKLTGLLGTDAGIQPGDSGGPLVDTSGQVVGMDTAASANYSFSGYAGSTSGGGQGSDTTQGYAIPITTALQIAGEIEDGESSSTVHLGPTAVLGVYVGGDNIQSATGSGVTVERTVSGGPAAKAGLTEGDIINAVNATTVGDADNLTALMATLSPGQTVTVTYTTAAGASRSTRVTLGTGAPQ